MTTSLGSITPVLTVVRVARAGVGVDVLAGGALLDLVTEDVVVSAAFGAVSLHSTQFRIAVETVSLMRTQ